MNRFLYPVRDLQLLRLFFDALRERVGQLVVLSNIAQDLHMSPTTAKVWLSLMKEKHDAFPIYPLTKQIPRAIQKPPKVYFYDNADVIDTPGAHLENLVATTLLKRLNFIEDYEGVRCQLHYIRDKEGREVDFVTVIDGTVDTLIEVKSTDTRISSSLHYFKEKLAPSRTVQLVGTLNTPFEKDGIEVLHPIDFFKDPPWQRDNSDERC